jgi:hypothetical protein
MPRSSAAHAWCRSGSCNDCHTQGYFFRKPDMARFLGGSDVGFALPGLGVFVGRNLTPDKETGLGLWSRAQIITVFTTGRRPDGRLLGPIMPWRAYANLKPTDAAAITAFPQSLPPVRHAVPGPFGPKDKVAVFVMDLLPADTYNSLLRRAENSPAPSRTPRDSALSIP